VREAGEESALFLDEERARHHLNTRLQDLDPLLELVDEIVKLG